VEVGKIYKEEIKESWGKIKKKKHAEQSHQKKRSHRLKSEQHQQKRDE